MDYATKFRIVRNARGLKQTELADMTGIPNTYISLIETGKMIPSGDWETKLKAALDWPADDGATLLAEALGA